MKIKKIITITKTFEVTIDLKRKAEWHKQKKQSNTGKLFDFALTLCHWDWVAKENGIYDTYGPFCKARVLKTEYAEIHHTFKDI